MKSNKKKLIVHFFIGICCIQSSVYSCPNATNKLLFQPCYRNWFVLFYLGKMTNDNLGEVVSGRFSLNTDTLYSLEVGNELDPCNPFRLFFQPVVSSIDVRSNITLLDDAYGKLVEFNPYIAANWRLPWCRYLKTTLTFGEGVSYITKVPYTEELNSDQPKRLLNFLLFEVAFASPVYPQWELVARIHHRSGVFGLYHANNTGSTAVGLALRYWFNLKSIK